MFNVTLTSDNLSNFSRNFSTFLIRTRKHDKKKKIVRNIYRHRKEGCQIRNPMGQTVNWVNCHLAIKGGNTRLEKSENPQNLTKSKVAIRDSESERATESEKEKWREGAPNCRAYKTPSDPQM